LFEKIMQEKTIKIISEVLVIKNILDIIVLENIRMSSDITWRPP
jgi:hypothetical protein